VDTNIGVGIAFLAGLLSFLSPCVFPLIPAYVSYMGTRAAMQSRGEMVLATAGAGPTSSNFSAVNRSALMLHGTLFVLGQMLVFVLFGILANISIRAIASTSFDLQRYIAKFGGLLVIFFGLYVIGAVGWVINILINHFAWEEAGALGIAIKKGLERLQGILFTDTRRQINPRNPYGYAGSVMMGVIFAAGWTPCLTPTYGAILTMVAEKQEIWGALLPLIAYSLGLGVPFLFAALALNQVRGFFKRIQKHMRAIEVVSGALLILMGVLLYTERLADLAQTTNGINTFAGNLETCTVDLFSGQIPSGDYNICMQLGPNYKYLTPTAQPQSLEIGGGSVISWFPRV
jgi:cytochrome c-type biogenesis protein